MNVFSSKTLLIEFQSCEPKVAELTTMQWDSLLYSPYAQTSRATLPAVVTQGYLA